MQDQAATVDFSDVPERSRRVPGLSSILISIPILIVSVFAIVGLFGSQMTPHDPDKQQLAERLRPPAWQDGGNWEYPLGTDHLGRDQLSRLIVGTRISFTVVVTAIPVSILLGMALGIVAGWRRGFVERGLMRLVDIQLAFPAVLFAVLLAAIFGPSLRNVIIIIVLWSWAGTARVVRGEVLSLRERDFVLSARAIGATDLRIVVRHLTPNLVNVVVVLATLDIATVILAEASLSFLGIGIPVSTPSWGSMVAQGRDYMTVAWWLIAFPGLAILLVSLAGNLLGDWLRDVLEPRAHRGR